MSAETAKKRGDYIHFVWQKLRPTLSALELERAAALKKFVKTCVLLVPVVVVLVVLAYRAMPPFGMFVAMAGLVGIVAAYHACTDAYRTRFKERIIGPLVRFFSPTLVFDANTGIEESELAASGLFRNRIDDYASEDLVRGTLGVTEVRFSEVHARREGSGKNKSKVTVFRGVFFIADFNKHFRGRTYVLPDNAQKLLGRFGQSLQSFDSTYGEIVKLEDVEFEREFVVYGSDQVEARYILSSALMERISEFRRRCRRTVRLAFVGSKVFLAIDSSRDLFEPPLFRPLTPEAVEEYWSDIQLFGGVVEALNLNTRIWTKE